MPDVSNNTDVSPRPLAVAWANSSRKRRKEIDHKDNSGSSRNEGGSASGQGGHRWGEEKNTQAPNLTDILRKITTNLITVLMPGEEKD